MTIKKTSVKDEKELQDLLFKNPEAIEEGMKFIAKEVTAHDNRRIDLLGNDSKGSLVIVELKLEANEYALIQLLDYADFAFRYFRLLSERYSELNLKKDFDPAQNIRIIAVAESFDQAFKRLVPHIDWEIESFRFQALQTDSGEKTVICLTEDVPELPHLPQEKPSDVSYHLDYITKDEAREAAQLLINQIKSLGDVEAVPTLSYIGFRTKKHFASIYTRRSYVILWYRDENDREWYEWPKHIESQTDLDDELETCLKKSYDASF